MAGVRTVLAAWLLAAPQVADPGTIIIPLSDFQREAVISPTREGLAKLGRDVKTLEGWCRNELRRVPPADPDHMAFGEDYLGKREGLPVRLTEIAGVEVRPLTFLPEADLKALAGRLIWPRGGDGESGLTEASRLAGRARNLVPLVLPHIQAAGTFEECRPACWALKYLGPHAAEAVPVLGRKLEKAENLDKTGYGETLSAIGDPALPELGRLLEKGGEWTRGEAARSLAKAGKEGLAEVRRALASPVEEIRFAAAEGLRKSTDAENIPSLIPLLRDPSEKVQYAAAYSLSDHGPAAKEAVPALLGMLDGRSPEVRRSAIWALGSIRIPEERIVPRLVEFLRPSEADRLCEAALQALAKFGPAAAPAVPAIPACLGRATQIRTAALLAVAAIGRDAAPCPEAIDRCLKGLPSTQDYREADLVAAGLEALAALGPDSAPAVDRVLQLIRKSSLFDHRAAGAFALGAIGPAARKGLPDMVPLLFGYRSVSLPPRWVLRFMAAIDIDEAIKVIEADIRRNPKEPFDFRVHDHRAWAVEELKRLGAEARRIDAALAHGTYVKGAGWRVNPELLLKHARLLRKGDALERVVALLGPPARLEKAGVLHYEARDSWDRVEATIRVQVRRGKVESVAF